MITLLVAALSSFWWLSYSLYTGQIVVAWVVDIVSDIPASHSVPSDIMDSSGLLW